MESDTLWERLKQGILDGASSAAETAGYLGRLGKARLEIANARHTVHGAFAELGGAVYAAVERGETSNLADRDDVTGLIRSIRELERDLQDREAILEDLKAGREPTATDTGADEEPATPSDPDR